MDLWNPYTKALLLTLPLLLWAAKLVIADVKEHGIPANPLKPVLRPAYVLAGLWGCIFVFLVHLLRED